MLGNPSFKCPKTSISSQPSAPDITAQIASKRMSSKSCFLQRSMRRSVIRSKCFRKVGLIFVTKEVLCADLITEFDKSSIYNDLAVWWEVFVKQALQHHIPLLQDKEALFVHHSHPLLVNQRREADTELYPLLQVTPDSDAYQHLIENPQPKQLERERKKVSERIVYEINSLTASIDILSSTTAIMPYPLSMADYFSQADIVPLPLAKDAQTGTVGIYHLNEILVEHVADIKHQLVLNGQLT